MRIVLGVKVYDDDGTYLGASTHEEESIPPAAAAASIRRMAAQLAEGATLKEIVDRSMETSAVLHTTNTVEQRHIPAPSVPRRMAAIGKQTPIERAIESGEVPRTFTGRNAAIDRRLYLIDRALAAIRDVGRAFEQDRTTEYAAAVSRAVAAGYNLALDRYMPQHLASLLDLVTPEEQASDILADTIILLSQQSAEMQRRGYNGLESYASYQQAERWLRQNRPDLASSLKMLPQLARAAWNPRQPTGRTSWSPGDTVRLSDVSAAIFNTPPIRRRILVQIARERFKQGNLWPPDHDDRHTAHDWLAILVQELAPLAWHKNHDDYRNALIKVAAVAAAAAEAYDLRDPAVTEALAQQEQGDDDH